MERKPLSSPLSGFFIYAIRHRGDAYHINGSLKTYQGTEVFGYALHQLLNKRCFVMSVNMEQYQWWTKKGFLRRLQWFYLFNVGIGRKIKAIGCTGLTGVKAFRKAWISDRRLFVFIYSVPEPNSYLLQEYSQPIDSLINNRMGGVKFIYMGQIAHRKCIIELVRSFREIQGNWTLDIVGGGPQEDEIRQAIYDDRRIHYWGKLMPSQARKVLASADVLLQTSRLEGCKRLHDDVLHISKKPLRGELSGFLSIYQAEASCISPKVY